MGFPGVGPQVRSRWTGQLFRGPVFGTDFGLFSDAFLVPSGSHFGTFFLSALQFCFFMIFGNFWDRFWSLSEPQK